MADGSDDARHLSVSVAFSHISDVSDCIKDVSCSQLSGMFI